MLGFLPSSEKSVREEAEPSNTAVKQTAEEAEDLHSHLDRSLAPEDQALLDEPAFIWAEDNIEPEEEEEEKLKQKRAEEQRQKEMREEVDFDWLGGEEEEDPSLLPDAPIPPPSGTIHYDRETVRVCA